MMSPRTIVGSLAFVAAVSAMTAPTLAGQTVKVGLSLPLTGPFEENGREMMTALKLFVEQNGDTVAGKKIEMIVRDDGGVPDQAKRIAQELVVQDKVAILAGYNPTPTALAVAPLATEAKVPEIVAGSSASITTERSSYIVRTLSTQSQITVPIAQWALQNGIKRVVTLVSDFAPGIETEKAFVDAFTAGGGTVVEQLRAPLQNPDFAPFLQRARDARPDAVFAWVPGGIAAPFLRQYVERGLPTSGIKLIGPGDITDDDVVNQMGDSMLGITTSLQYSAAHPSAKNKSFVEGFRRLGGGLRPDHVGVAMYDCLSLIYAALQKTNGNTGGDALIAAMKGMSWESPRGPVSIDPATRDIVQNIYIRRVERRDGELYNVEFDTFEAVKDPIKAAHSN
jgi:branched-chain amino acid transport system substrate-binding protein